MTDPFAAFRRENQHRPFPMAPLLPFLGTAEPGAIAHRFGIAVARARDWLAHGLTVWDADKAATALGMHPACVWGEAWTSVGLDDLAIDLAIERQRRRLRREVAA